MLRHHLIPLALVATLAACASAPDTSNVRPLNANAGIGGGTPVGTVDIAPHKLAGNPGDYELDDNVNTDVQPTNAEAEALLRAEADRAIELLRTHGTAFRQLVQRLLDAGMVPAAEFAQVTGLPVAVVAEGESPASPEAWHARWLAYVGGEDGAAQV